MFIKSVLSRTLFVMTTLAVAATAMVAPATIVHAAPSQNTAFPASALSTTGLPASTLPGAAPVANVGAPLTCVGTIYATGQASGGTGTLLAINTSTGESTPVPVAGGKVGDNSLGMSSDGKFTYSYRNNPDAGYPIVVNDVATGALQEFPTSIGERTIRGAVNPVDGLFYLSGSGANASVYVFDTKNNTLVGKIGNLSPDVTSVGSNGDFAFDSNGTLYITSGERLYRATNDVPTTAGKATISMTTIAVLPGGTNSPAVGIRLAQVVRFGFEPWETIWR